MPRFQVRVPTDDRLAYSVREGGQLTVDIGDGEVANAELVEMHTIEDGGTILTFEAPRAALAMYVGDERVEVQVLEG
jgi:hypothetical protein